MGDRLDTDVQGARGAEMRSVHVLTGIDRPKQLLAASPNQRPDYIVADLRQLFEPYPATIVTGARTRVGDAVVEIDGVDLRIVSAGNRQ
ncbi:HAD hydrolase-like protein, partial [Pseudomonas aeruginosa]|uniref:HAD hydrolase-like protein n=1 Tax=Pseudomonas aeruginosa TaxID=287 RepID=UPI002F91E79F